MKSRLPNEHGYLAFLYLYEKRGYVCANGHVAKVMPSGAMMPLSRPNRNGYWRIPFRFNGVRYEIMEHVFNYIRTHGKWPRRGQQINHEDLNRSNNDPANLTLVSQSENLRHAAAMRRAGVRGGKR